MWVTLILLVLLKSVSCEATSVIIIGAGPAGIAAASELLQNNVTEVKIFEAENRTGGRIFSLKFGNAIVDLGAEYCHGEEGNVVYELANKYDLLEKREHLHGEIYYSNGTRITSPQLLQLANLYPNSRPLLPDVITTNVSMGEQLTKLFQSYTSPNLNPEQYKILNESIQLAEQTVLGLEGSFTWFSSSARNHYQQCPGNQEMTWKGRGYKTILEVLTKSYPNTKEKLPIDDKIYLSTTVKNITTNGASGLTVTTQDGMTHTSDYVIFTPSIGVLKRNEKSLFIPQLPDSKLKAINALGSEGIMKVLIRFKTKWWHGNVGYSLLWKEEDRLKSGELFSFGPKIDNRISWITHIAHIGPQIAEANPNVAISWVFGPLVPQIEDLSTEIIKSGFEFVLNRFFGRDFNVSGIEEILWSKWCTNPNFLGTYSFLRAGFYHRNISHNRLLAEPIRNPQRQKSALLFAGEATNPVHYSTVHGAIETGFREAQRILDVVNNQ